MTSDSDRRSRGFRFSIRHVLAAMAVVALFFMGRAFLQDVDRKVAELQNQVRYYEAEAGYRRYRGSVRARAQERNAHRERRLLFGASLAGASLCGATITGGPSSFQGTALDDCDLEGASLTGGGSDFQGASFERANLRTAKLSGGGAAFQMARFTDADLSGATLRGGAGAFQGASLEDANLTGATIACSGGTAFQAVNVDGAQFQGADLSSIEAESLQSCHFRKPPTYDDATRFPSGFDAVDAGWQRVD